MLVLTIIMLMISKLLKCKLMYQKHFQTIYKKCLPRQESPIIDFYPDNFAIDLNGKKFAWQGMSPIVDDWCLAWICIVPFYSGYIIVAWLS